jgi:alkylation response protein AidB-like acyl-CoA dehydrogenase
VTASPVADQLVVCAVIDGPQRPRPLCFALMPRDHAEVLDTWKVDGLRGTGSNDVVLTDRFVPEHLCGCVAKGTHTVPDVPLYRLHPGLRFPFPKVAVAAGIARAATEAFVELAGAKQQILNRHALRERPAAADAVAEAVALRASGWSYVHDVLAEVWAHAEAGRRVPRELHARARLACAFSIRNSVRAVETVCSAAGTSANFVDSSLSRHFRDVHAVPQHFTVAPFQMTTAGRVLLGLPSGDPAF